MKLRRYMQDSRFFLAENIGFPYELESRGWTKSGTPSATNSPVGKAGFFNGATPDYWTIPDTDTETWMNATTDYITVMAWVCPTYVHASYSAHIIAREGDSAGWSMYLTKVTRVPQITLKGLAGLNGVSFFNTDAVALNTWTHLACSFYVDTGTIANNVGTFYVNGDATNTDVLRSIDTIVSNSDITVGARAAGDSPFYGGIADPMIVKGELSAQEIENIALGVAF